MTRINLEAAHAAMLDQLRHTGLAERMLATHVDDGTGHCSASCCGAGRVPYPCSTRTLAAVIPQQRKAAD